MNVIFLTIGRMYNVENRGIYTDLLRTFRDNGHNVYVVSANEKRHGKETEFVEESGIHALRVKIGNITKCGMIEKGISTVMVESQFIRAIKKYLSDVKFDLVIYSTPPITFAKAVEYIKKRDGARSYLLLKDIFPQNAVDIGIMSKSGIKGILYKFFRNKEKKLYEFSDRIGCMSQANVDYLLRHNPEIEPEKVEICPNSIEVIDMRISEEERVAIRKKYDIPTDKKVFVYGGNLGRPQGIPFLIDCLRAEKENKDVYFLIVGDGTEYSKLEAFVNEEKPASIRLMKSLPKEDYDKMVAACDIGMIFLDHRFTIPNFPSRLLSYMQAGLPILAATDPNTDIGKVIVDGGFGWWCESNDTKKFSELVKRVEASDLSPMKQKAFDFLGENYTAALAYRTICKKYTKEKSYV